VTKPIEVDDATEAWPRHGAESTPAHGGPEGTDHAETAPPIGPGGVSMPVRLALVGSLVLFFVLQFGISAMYIVAALLISIILHEFGHYWVAKRSGMKVSEFFVGFGPRLWSFRRGETEYGLKAIPAGAYVRIVGMNDFEEVDPVDEPRTYRAQGTFKRLFTVLAGPAMNLLIAFVLMATLFLAYGRESEAWAVKRVSAGSSAELGGVAPGDRLLAVDGQPVGEWDSFRGQLAEKAGRPVLLTVEHDGVTAERNVNLGWRLDPAASGLVPSQPVLNPGDVIESADGSPLARYEDLRTLLAVPDGPVTLRVIRANHPYALTVTRPLALPADGAAGFLGVEPTTEMVKETPVGAVGETLRVLRDGVAATGGVFGRLFSPSGISSMAGQVADATQTTTTLPPNTVGRLTPVEGSPEPTAPTALAEDRPISIIGIFQLGREAADIGLPSFLLLVACVNLALALINLLPMLPLDGGHAVIALYEGARGRLQGAPYRADLTKLMPFVYGFIAVLILLGGSTMLLDALRPPSLR
jgi:RIP metalloprotease RseP